ncbi:apolipoprotein L6-like [Hoplias malabaricus]|uniref:apolipoprotein L6-like n=1 Tax=Hoplias malabaricus TaxID=27720 RepID=UPI0034626A65
MDECFRLTYLFNGSAQEFIETYSGCRSRMFQFLSALEEAAVQFDKMKFRSSITTVVGSSLSIVASVLSLAGLALAPSTSGWSLSLTAIGLWLGVTSGVTSLVTGIFKAVIDYQQGSTTNDIFKDFMEDVQKVLDCIEKASSRKREVPHLDFNVLKNVKKYGKELWKSVNDIKSAHEALENLKSEEVTKASDCQKATKSCSIPSLAAECPDLGPLAKDTPLVVSKTASIWKILTNSLSIGMDLYAIYKESISLFRGDKSEASELIHSRSTLLRSEIEVWGKFHDYLLKGEASYQKSLKILE